MHLLPHLQRMLSDVSFVTLDPNEEWDVPEHMVVLDTVVNVPEITTVTDLDAFMAAPRMTCHDFDAYANLMLLKKLGAIQRVTIVGIPPGTAESTDIARLVEHLRAALEDAHAFHS